MTGDIAILPFDGNDADLDAIGELYCMTFSGQGYSREDKENAISNIRKHASYQGFKGLKAMAGQGNVAGFTYGYTSLPDQFYRQKLAAQLSEKEINTWLDDCFEFVELAVGPFHKRLGIGGRLHDFLLDKNDHKTSVLTTGIENSPAIHLYRKKGWTVIKNDAPVISGADLQVIMGKKLD